MSGDLWEFGADGFETISEQEARELWEEHEAYEREHAAELAWLRREDERVRAYQEREAAKWAHVPPMSWRGWDREDY